MDAADIGQVVDSVAKSGIWWIVPKHGGKVRATADKFRTKWISTNHNRQAYDAEDKSDPRKTFPRHGGQVKSGRTSPGHCDMSGTRQTSSGHGVGGVRDVSADRSAKVSRDFGAK